MVATALIAVAFWALLSVWRFVRNPYEFDPHYIKLQQRRAYAREMAVKHSKAAARSTGKRAEFHAAMEAKWKEALSIGRLPEPDPPEPE